MYERLSKCFVGRTKFFAGHGFVASALIQTLIVEFKPVLKYFIKLTLQSSQIYKTHLFQI